MADLALGVVKDIVKIGKAIQDAIETLHRNDEVCQDLLGLADTIKNIVSWLEKMELSHPGMRGALTDLNGSVHRAHKLVTECQKKKVMHRFFAAGGMAKQLRWVRDDILLKMQLVNLAINASMMEITIELTRTTIVRYDGAHPPPTQPQGAAEMEIYSSHSTIGDARFEEDDAGIMTMVTTGTEAPFAPSSSNISSSGLTEFSLSEAVATHHVPEENISEGSGYAVVSEFKIEIKIWMTSDRQRAKAMSVAAAAAGVISMAIVGEGKDQLVIVGEGLDSVKLTTTLRKVVGHAEVSKVGPMDKTSAVEGQPTVVSAEEAAQPKPANRCTNTRSSGLPRFIWQHARRSASRLYASACCCC